MQEYVEVLGSLVRANVRFLVIGVTGVNFYVIRKHVPFNTGDCDVFLPLDPENLLACWQVMEPLGFEFTSHGEPLEIPLDLWLARRVVERRAVVQALGPGDLRLDLTLMMRGFYFDSLWAERRTSLSKGRRSP